MPEKESDIEEPKRLSPDEVSKLWPIYHRDELAIGNNASSIAVNTLWSRRQGLEEKLDKNEYAVIGQCFSPRGVNLILRELIASPFIRTLVTWGNDRSHTGDYMATFFEQGFNDDHTLPGIDPYKFTLNEEIPLEQLEALRQNVRHVDLRGEVGNGDFKSAAQAIRSLEGTFSDPWRDHGMRYPLVNIKPDIMPGELVGYTVRGKTFGETWLQIIDVITRFGRMKRFKDEDDKQDVQELMAIVEGDEDYKHLVKPEIFARIPDFVKPEIFARIPNFSIMVDEYVEQLTSDVRLEGIDYSYGELLFAHDIGGGERVNQIDDIVEKLARNPHTGRAFAGLWNVGEHMGGSETPCLTGIRFAAIQETEREGETNYKLGLSARFRTHDMFNGWPPNALGLRALQYLVLGKLQPAYAERGSNLSLGPLITLSGSAHMYEAQIGNALETLEEFPVDKHKTYDLSGRLMQDPRGNYRISIEEGKIKIQHIHPTKGEPIDSGLFTPNQATRWLADQRVIDLPHAIYLGREIEKASQVIQLNRAGVSIDYVQDRPLKLKDAFGVRE